MGLWDDITKPFKEVGDEIEKGYKKTVEYFEDDFFDDTLNIGSQVSTGGLVGYDGDDGFGTGWSADAALDVTADVVGELGPIAQDILNNPALGAGISAYTGIPLGNFSQRKETAQAPIMVGQTPQTENYSPPIQTTQGPPWGIIASIAGGLLILFFVTRKK